MFFYRLFMHAVLDLSLSAVLEFSGEHRFLQDMPFDFRQQILAPAVRRQGNRTIQHVNGKSV